MDRPASNSWKANLEVVRGQPTEEELAALLTALAVVRRSTTGSTAGTGRSGEPAGLSAWGAYWYRLGQRPQPGTTGWRASALPR